MFNFLNPTVMKTALPILISIIILLNNTLFAGNTNPLFIGGPIKKSYKASVGVGQMYSILYLSRNIKEDNNAKGYFANVTIAKPNSLYRFSAQYTFFKPIDIAPTWYDIKARTFEANVEFIAKFKNGKTMLYPFAGICYNRFQGFFTGVNDLLNLKDLYGKNTIVVNRWPGLNVGTGIEHKMGPISLFADYRMRVGVMDRGGFNIMDICYGFGAKFNFDVNITLNPKDKTKKQKAEELVEDIKMDYKPAVVEDTKDTPEDSTADKKKTKKRSFWQSLKRTFSFDRYHWF